MALVVNDASFERMGEGEIAEWREIPTAVISDDLNRTGTMHSVIKPLGPGMGFAGQALTAQTMVGDNGISHAAIPLVNAGEVLVIDAGGYEDVAVWGAIMTHAAMKQGIAGVVIDGAVRDVAEIRELGFAVFARAHVPSGPHKGFGGIIDGAISCAGCPVNPGDLVIGDDDGVCVVPLQWTDRMLIAAQEKIRQEEDTLKQIAAGKTTAELLGVDTPEMIEG